MLFSAPAASDFTYRYSSASAVVKYPLTLNFSITFDGLHFENRSVIYIDKLSKTLLYRVTPNIIHQSTNYDLKIQGYDIANITNCLYYRMNYPDNSPLYKVPKKIIEGVDPNLFLSCPVYSTMSIPFSQIQLSLVNEFNEYSERLTISVISKFYKIKIKIFLNLMILIQI
jgi:hypothetical protein